MVSRGFAVHLVGILLFVSLLGGCSSGDAIIEMHDFFFDPDGLTFSSGDSVTVEIVNRGDVEHDIVIASGVFDMSLQAELAIAESPEIVVGRTDRLAPGESASLTVGFEQPGEYQYFCSILGHFFRGMRGVISIEP